MSYQGNQYFYLLNIFLFLCVERVQFSQSSLQKFNWYRDVAKCYTMCLVSPELWFNPWGEIK